MLPSGGFSKLAEHCEFANWRLPIIVTYKPLRTKLVLHPEPALLTAVTLAIAPAL